MRTASVCVPSRSNRNKNSPFSVEQDRPEDRDSCYYPGCLKDANCTCEFCLDSINATLDLMPISVQKSSLTKLSVSRPELDVTPISFTTSTLSTPTSGSFQMSSSPPAPKSGPRLDLDKEMMIIIKGEKEKQHCVFWGNFLKLVLGFGLIYFVDVGLCFVLSGILQPVLSPDMLRKICEKSWIVKDLDPQDMHGKLGFLKGEMEGIVDGNVSNCSISSALWEINQDGLLLKSTCTMYKSATEEVIIWGWPLQTAGLLTTGFSLRSFTILSGRVTEWSDGRVGYVIRKANASWVHRKWGASAVQLDPNTWILEYKRSSIYDHSRLYSAAAEFLKHWVSRMVGKMMLDFWLFSANFEDIIKYGEIVPNYGNQAPT